MSFNKITIVGNLGRDPELNYTPQGTAVCKFSMATNEKRRDKSGEMLDSTTWFRVTVWGKQAETASKYLSKGTPVFIEGRLRVEEWTDRDGKTRHTIEVHATDMQFLSSGSGAAAAGSSNESGVDYQGSEMRRESQNSRAFSAGAAISNGAVGGPQYSGPSDDDIPF